MLYRGVSSLGRQRPLSILFFGTDNFSLHTLKALRKESLSPGGAVSRLEVCCTRMKSLVSDVQAYSEQEGLTTHWWPPKESSLSSFDLGVVASFGHLLPKRVIAAFPRGILNVHASLLPRWRGASPVAHSIMSGDERTGVSIMEIRPHHFDVGCILAQESVHVSPDAFRGEVTSELGSLGAQLILKVIRDLDIFEAEKWPQDESRVTLAPRLNKHQLFCLKWSELSAKELWNRYRAIGDLGKFYAVWRNTGDAVRLTDMVRPSELECLSLDQRYPDAKPGLAIFSKRIKEYRLCIKCKCGWVAFNKLYYGEKRVMSPLDFKNGFMRNRAGVDHFFDDGRVFDK